MQNEIKLGFSAMHDAKRPKRQSPPAIIGRQQKGELNYERNYYSLSKLWRHKWYYHLEVQKMWKSLLLCVSPDSKAWLGTVFSMSSMRGH